MEKNPRQSDGFKKVILKLETLVSILKCLLLHVLSHLNIITPRFFIFREREQRSI